MTSLGPMGTATADSLREMGLEPPAPPAPAPPPRPRRLPPERPPALLGFVPALTPFRVLACGVMLAIAGLPVTSMLQVQRDQVREIEYQTQRYLRALDQMEHVTERRLEQVEHSGREVAAAVRRIEEAQARLVRAERRARRLAHGRRP